MSLPSYKILLLPAIVVGVLFIAWKKKTHMKNKEAGERPTADDLIDLSEWVNLPQKDYAEKVWSLLEERAFPRRAKEGTPVSLLFIPEQETYPAAEELHIEPQDLSFQLCQPSLLHFWFKKYIYNRESFYLDENTHEPFEDPSVLQVFFKKYIYNSDYVFIYSENGATTALGGLAEEPSVLQIWYRLYIYNPAYKSLLTQKIAPSVDKKILKTEPTTLLEASTPEQIKKRSYARSNGYQYREGDDTLSISSLASPNEKIALQDEVNRIFSQYFDEVATGPKEETNIWGDPIPTF